MGEWGRSKSRGVAWLSCVINAAMATSKLGWQGQGSQGGEGAAGRQRRAIAVTALRRRLGVMAVKCQASSLLGRLETLGPGGTAALARRQQAGELERRWQREMRAQAQATREGWRALRSGFGKVD